MFCAAEVPSLQRVLSAGKASAASRCSRRSTDARTKKARIIHVRRRYVTVDQLRRAIAIVTNGTLIACNPAIWGEGTTACASDSKHFWAWDQNLTTQWHVRYGGRGIKSLCIHSQLKSPSSSEVAAMIEGVIGHCTEIVNRPSVRRQPWPKRGCFRVLSSLGV